MQEQETAALRVGLTELLHCRTCGVSYGYESVQNDKDRPERFQLVCVNGHVLTIAVVTMPFEEHLKKSAQDVIGDVTEYSCPNITCGLPLKDADVSATSVQGGHRWMLVCCEACSLRFFMVTVERVKVVHFSSDDVLDAYMQLERCVTLDQIFADTLVPAA